MKNLVIGFLFIYFWCEVLAKTIDSKELSVIDESDGSDMQLLPLEPNKDQIAESKKSKLNDKSNQRDRQKMKKMQMMRSAEAKTFLDDEEDDDDDAWSEMIGEIWNFVLQGMQRMVSSMAGMAMELMGS